MKPCPNGSIGVFVQYVESPEHLHLHGVPGLIVFQGLLIQPVLISCLLGAGKVALSFIKAGA